MVGSIILIAIYLNNWIPTPFVEWLSSIDLNDYGIIVYWSLFWASYLVGLLLHRILEALDFLPCLNLDKTVKAHCRPHLMLLSFIVRNYPEVMWQSKQDVDMIWTHGVFQESPRPTRQALLKEYYIAYFECVESTNFVRTLEAYSALFKDIIVASLLFLPILNTCCALVVYTLFIVALMWSRYYCEYKIRYLIWEKDAYEKEKEKDKDKNKDEIAYEN